MDRRKFLILSAATAGSVAIGCDSPEEKGGRPAVSKSVSPAPKQELAQTTKVIPSSPTQAPSQTATQVGRKLQVDADNLIKPSASVSILDKDAPKNSLSSLPVKQQEPKHKVIEATGPKTIAPPEIKKAVSIAKDTLIFDENYFKKIKNPNAYFPGDVVATAEEYKSIYSCLQKIKRCLRNIGFGNFNIVGFNQVFKTAKRLRIPFNNAEIETMIRFYTEDPSLYGFYGKRLVTSDLMRYEIKRKEVQKVHGSGHYIYRGEPEQLYLKLKSEISQFKNSKGRPLQAILTSGIRGPMKQTYLFLNKVVRLAQKKGGLPNISAASRSIAPPGCSWHIDGDFDVGEPRGGWNFSPKFAKTDLFKKLDELGYIQLRYTKKNLKGVRFEPWHIMVNPEQRMQHASVEPRILPVESYDGIEDLVAEVSEIRLQFYDTFRQIWNG